MQQILKAHTHTHTHTERDHLTTLAVCEAVFWKPSLLAGGMVKTHVLLKESTHTHCQRVFLSLRTALHCSLKQR